MRSPASSTTPIQGAPSTTAIRCEGRRTTGLLIAAIILGLSFLIYTLHALCTEQKGTISAINTMNRHTGHSLPPSRGSPMSPRNQGDLSSPTTGVVNMLERTSNIQARAMQRAMEKGDVEQSVHLQQNAEQSRLVARSLREASRSGIGRELLLQPVQMIPDNAPGFLPRSWVTQNGTMGNEAGASPSWQNQTTSPPMTLGRIGC